jgi:hypothetical protein
MMTLKEVMKRTKSITPRGLRFACMRGDVPGAQKPGRDWLIPLEGLEYFLLHRRKGRKPRKVDKVGGV